MEIQPNQSQVAWSVKEFTRAASIGPTTFYAQVKEGRIKTAKLGAKTLVLTSPREFIDTIVAEAASL